jgi:ribosomal-protein-serine acetyltransferase
MNRIQIRTAVENTRSRAVAERLGFKFEGTLRDIIEVCGKPQSLDIHSLLKEEWVKRSSEFKV